MKRLKSKKGQSLVEFTIIFPLLLLVVMGIIEFGVMLNSYLAINNAAREGARAGIVGSSSAEIENLIISTSPGLNAEGLIITVTPGDTSRKSGDTLTVKVTYNYHLTVPIISSIFNNVVVLNAQVSMRIE
ncbi:MAG: pilus assembly protein [Firmicutes bacterium]|nr:pilus assembly protein [Bacillota bacterium]